MADEADLANDFIDSEVSRAIRKIQQNTTAKPGPEFCVKCADKIPALRRKMGFKLCVECAEEAERRGALFADY